jgi:4-hydroxy-4-methyl-2-oxoglutarate aldolase
MSSPSIPDAIIERFRAVTTASLSDVLDKIGVAGSMDPAIKPLFPAKLVGPAVTVLEVLSNEPPAPPEDVVRAVDTAPPGSVIVIGTEGEAGVAVWGGLLAACAAFRGLAGAALDGGVRDADEIRRDGRLPVYARSAVPRSSIGRMRTRGTNLPITCGGVRVRPGDLIIGDGDGVMVVPAERMEEVLQAAEAIEERERAMLAELRRTPSMAEASRKFLRA